MKELLISIVENYGGLGIFVLLFLEFIGLPISGQTSMLVLGFISSNGVGYSLFINILYASAGTFLGYTVAYIIGYRYGYNFILKYKRIFHVDEEKLNLLNEKLNKHKLLLIVFSRYVMGVRHIIPYLCGIGKMNLKVFLIYNLLGSLFWCSSFLILGYYVGDEWEWIENILKTYTVIIVIVLVFIFIVIKFFKKHRKIIFIIAVPLLLFIILIQSLIEQELSIFDNRMYSFLSQFFSDGMTDYMIFISFLGSWSVLVSIAIISLILFWKKDKYSFYGKMIAINLAVSYILNVIFKVIFQRERPDIMRLIDISGFSFPSGHSMVGISFYGFIIYLCYKFIKGRWRYISVFLLSILIALIGISRVYLGVHYPSDVLAGFSAGLAWLAIFIVIIDKIYSFKYDKNVELKE